MTILVVDDCRSALKIMERKLSHKGYEVITSTKPLEVLNILEKYTIHLIIMDYRMPDMDGIELTGLVKEWTQQNHVDIPVILHTAVDKRLLPQEEIEKWEGIMVKPVTEKDMQLLYNCISESYAAA